MSKQYKAAVVVGRFQPMHFGHIAMIKKAIELAEKVYIFIGSCNKPRTIENPFNYDERSSVVMENVLELDREGVTCGLIPLDDFMYNDNRWKEQVINKLGGETDVVVVGGEKDTWFKQIFPEFALELVPTVSSLAMDCINATAIRELYFTKSYDESMPVLNAILPKHTVAFLKEFRNSKWYSYIALELDKIRTLNKQFGKGPFLTVDSIITKYVDGKKQILLVQRKNHPGKGLYAVPGGFLDNGEDLLDAARRELREETGLDLPRTEYEHYMIEMKMFDHPKRSVASRIVTSAHFVILPPDMFTKIEAGDDAARAFFYPIEELYKIKNLFYDDHYDMIEYFLTKYGQMK